MNFISCRYLLALGVYTGTAWLMIVNGQATTDNDIDNYIYNEQINKLIDIVVELKTELAKTKNQFNQRIAELEGRRECKLFLHSDCSDNESTVCIAVTWKSNKKLCYCRETAQRTCQEKYCNYE